MPAQKIGAFFRASSALRALSARAQRLMELQQVLIESVPASLAHASRVKHVRAGTLFLSADNAAVAAKLRQLTPRLLLKFQKRDSEVTGIRVEVQVARTPSRAAAVFKTTRLDVDAIENFRKLASRLEDCPLKAAIDRLVARHSPKR